ncbi:MAG: hypothetical protein FJX71_02480 [Alphaproteobacteria bacterium]|nr:hypothetical protein [Alphaproteobacteria bacterium]
MKTIVKLISTLSIGLWAFIVETKGADEDSFDWFDLDLYSSPQVTAAQAASPLGVNVAEKPADLPQSQASKVVVDFYRKSEIPLSALTGTNVISYFYILSSNEERRIDITPETTFPFTVELQANPKAISFISQQLGSTVISIGRACFSTHELEGRHNNLARNKQEVPQYSHLEILLSMSLNPPRVTYTQQQLDIVDQDFQRKLALLNQGLNPGNSIPIVDGNLMAGTELRDFLHAQRLEKMRREEAKIGSTRGVSEPPIVNVYDRFGTGCVITRAVATQAP